MHRVGVNRFSATTKSTLSALEAANEQAQTITIIYRAIRYAIEKLGANTGRTRFEYLLLGVVFGHRLMGTFMEELEIYSI